MASLGFSFDSISAPYINGNYGAGIRREQADKMLPEGASRAQGEGKPEEKARRGELSPAEQRQVAELQQIDRAVRAHEQAHLSAGRGVVTSGASFSYAYGPDGRQYAVAGEVGIDTSMEKKPEDNIDKGRRIQAAALAPSDPSAQDHRVAAIGAQMEGKGHSDLARQRREEIGRTYGAPEAAPGGSISVFA